MSTFQVPFSSSLPSTPDSRRQGRGFTGSPGSNPSTTPAGEPGRPLGSFTPAGPPPSTPFGSSQLGLNNPISGRGTSLFPDRAPRRKSPSPSREQVAGQGRHVRTPSFDDPSDGDDEDDEEYEDEEDGEDEGEDEDEDEDENEDENMLSDEEVEETGSLPRARAPVSKPSSRYPGGVVGRVHKQAGNQPFSRGAKKPRTAGRVNQSHEQADNMDVDQGEPSAIPRLVRDYIERSTPAAVNEPDNLILGTQERLSHLYNSEGNQFKSPLALSMVSEELLELWESSADNFAPNSNDSDTAALNVASNEAAPTFVKALVLSSLLLRIHHPPSLKPSNAFSRSRAGGSIGFSRSLTHRGAASGRAIPFPKVILDWINVYHDPYPNALEDIRSHRPDPANHPNFWDVILTYILRGKLNEVLRTLKAADFRYSNEEALAMEEEEDDEQLSDDREDSIANIQKVVDRAIEVLEQCPVISNNDWDVTGSSWASFRLKVSQASKDLTLSTGGLDPDDPATTFSFSAENFGIQNNKDDGNVPLSRAIRKAGNQVPMAVYLTLKSLYGILWGSTTEIISASQDWIEASIGLTAWWNGEADASELGETLTRRSRPVSMRSSGGARELEPGPSYLERLAWSFRRATDSKEEDTFSPKTLSIVEPGLASIMEGDVEGAVGILRGWSLVIASTVVEMAREGNWLNPGDGDKLLGAFNQSDLMLLGFDRPAKTSWHDRILIAYAEGLFGRGRLHNADSARQGAKDVVAYEAWELGLQVLGRVDDVELASKKAGELLDRLHLDSGSQVDKLLNICTDIALGEQGRRIAEVGLLPCSDRLRLMEAQRYADSLAENSYKYGETVIYYARAHQRKKLRNVLDLLVSFCLVQSVAYPPEAEMDEHLKQLISSPEKVLTELSQVDYDAAEMLQYSLSGYATVRTFYDLRDEVVNMKDGQRPKSSEDARKRQAVSALLATINSASDSITGGLYDDKRESVVSVDGLLVLLGEASVFVDQPNRLLSLPQAFDLLRAIEDLETVSPRIYSQCEAFFQSALSSAQGSQAPSPQAMLKKTVSSMTGSSGFSLVGSSILATEAQGTEGSGVLVKADIKRGWDWRKGLRRGGTGKDVLRILRLGLAREIARGWLAGEEGF